MLVNRFCKLLEVAENIYSVGVCAINQVELRNTWLFFAQWEVLNVQTAASLKRPTPFHSFQERSGRSLN